MRLAENLKEVKEEIAQAAQQCGTTKKIKLVAVTKTVSAEVAKELVALGVSDLAENRAERLLEKQAVLHDQAITWHLIGTLQTRKIKDVINQIDYFHALDRMKTANEIQKRANKVINCFVQVNVSGENSKQGIALDETEEFILNLKGYTNIRVVGLMTMAPSQASDEELHHYFKLLATKQAEIAELHLPFAPCTELSMGMSQDFQIAIAQGATVVRIGSKLFRNK